MRYRFLTKKGGMSLRRTQPPSVKSDVGFAGDVNGIGGVAANRFQHSPFVMALRRQMSMDMKVKEELLKHEKYLKPCERIEWEATKWLSIWLHEKPDDMEERKKRESKKYLVYWEKVKELAEECSDEKLVAKAVEYIKLESKKINAM